MLKPQHLLGKVKYHYDGGFHKTLNLEKNPGVGRMIKIIALINILIHLQKNLL